MTRYIHTTEQAKMIRAALKKAFPSFKFDSITSKGSIRIVWTDGPTKKEVESITNGFKGGGYDHHADIATSHQAMMNGEQVSFLCNYISTERNYSEALISDAVKKLQGMNSEQYCDVLNNHEIGRQDLRTDEDLNNINKVARCYVRILSACPPLPVDGLPVINKTF